jgi:transcriptional regulator with XRE-family HTH domain
MAAKNNGKRLKHLRELAGISQAQVAKAHGFDRAYLSMIESGYRDLSEHDAGKVEAYLQGAIAKRARQLQAEMGSMNSMEAVPA